MRHVFIVEDSPDGLTVLGEALGPHRSIGGVEVEGANVVDVLDRLKLAILRNERRWANIPD